MLKCKYPVVTASQSTHDAFIDMLDAAEFADKDDDFDAGYENIACDEQGQNIKVEIARHTARMKREDSLEKADINLYGFEVYTTEEMNDILNKIKLEMQKENVTQSIFAGAALGKRSRQTVLSLILTKGGLGYEKHVQTIEQFLALPVEERRRLYEQCDMRALNKKRGRKSFMTPSGGPECSISGPQAQADASNSQIIPKFRTRVTLEKEIKQVLDAMYNLNPYIDFDTCQLLAKEYKIEVKTIKIYFANKRAQDKRRFLFESQNNS